MPARIPVTGFPHLFLAAQDDKALHARIIAHLKTAGYTVGETIDPPAGAGGAAIIAAITAAFLTASTSTKSSAA